MSKVAIDYLKNKYNMSCTPEDVIERVYKDEIEAYDAGLASIQISTDVQYLSSEYLKLLGAYTMLLKNSVDVNRYFELLTKYRELCNKFKDGKNEQ